VERDRWRQTAREAVTDGPRCPFHHVLLCIVVSFSTILHRLRYSKIILPSCLALRSTVGARTLLSHAYFVLAIEAASIISQSPGFPPSPIIASRVRESMAGDAARQRAPRRIWERVNESARVLDARSCEWRLTYRLALRDTNYTTKCQQ
jgi:hypothetical protein